MTFSNDSYLLLMRQDVDLSPIKLCNQLRNTVVLISQDPKKLKKKVAELCLKYGEEKEFSWAAPFSLPKKIYVVVYYTDRKMYSEVFLVKGEMASNNYNIQLGKDFNELVDLELEEEDEKSGFMDN